MQQKTIKLENQNNNNKKKFCKIQSEQCSFFSLMMNSNKINKKKRIYNKELIEMNENQTTMVNHKRYI